MEESSTDPFLEFAEAFYRNRPRYLKFAMRFIHIQDMSEDLVNEAFTKLWEKRSEIADTNIEGYYYAILRNHCLLWLRSKKTQNTVHNIIYENRLRALQYDIATLETFDTSLIFNCEIRDIMIRQLGEMSDITRKIFMDNRFANLSYEEIADNTVFPNLKSHAKFRMLCDDCAFRYKTIYP